MKNRCILLDHQVKPAMLRTVYYTFPWTIAHFWVPLIFLGKGTCWLICTLTRGKVEQWFVTHTCYQFCKRNTINTKRSGVIQSSQGLNWLSILIIRSEMVFPKEGVSTNLLGVHSLYFCRESHLYLHGLVDLSLHWTAPLFCGYGAACADPNIILSVFSPWWSWQKWDSEFSALCPSSIHNPFAQERGLAREGLRVLNAVLPEGLTINAMPF